MTHLYHLFTYLLVLGVVVTLHEAGHYLACKFQGINVDTFSIGFGPILASAEFWGTVFQLRAIPLGGFIIPAGIYSRPETAQPGDYFSKSWWKRLIVVYAGPAMNFVLAFFIFVGLLHFKGAPTYSSEPVLGEVSKGSSAEKAGLLLGDRVISINGEATPTWKALHDAISNSESPNLSINVVRNNYNMHFSAVLDKDTSWKLGVAPKIVAVPEGFLEASKESFRVCSFQVTQTFTILSNNLSHGKKTELAGPIGIYQAVAQASSDWVETFSLMAIISLSLGIFNLLPIPLLDGGSGVIFIWEGLTGKYPSIFAINVLQIIGILIIGFIFLFATAGDLVRIFAH